MSTERVAGHYSGESGERYFEWQRHGGELGAQLDLFKFAQHVRPEDSIVDFGCGAGYLLEALDAGAKVGVEPGDAARAEARRRGLEVVASAGELASESADVVISNHALEHTLVPFAELTELQRALKPGGKLVLWLPLDDWRAQRDVPAPGADRDQHMYTWTPKLLANLLTQAGFEVGECRVVAHAWPTSRYATLYRVLPGPLFALVARAWAVLRRRRQLAVVATRPA